MFLDQCPVTIVVNLVKVDHMVPAPVHAPCLVHTISNSPNYNRNINFTENRNHNNYGNKYKNINNILKERNKNTSNFSRNFMWHLVKIENLAYAKFQKRKENVFCPIGDVIIAVVKDAILLMSNIMGE